MKPATAKAKKVEGARLMAKATDTMLAATIVMATTQQEWYAKGEDTLVSIDLPTSFKAVLDKTWQLRKATDTGTQAEMETAILSRLVRMGVDALVLSTFPDGKPSDLQIAELLRQANHVAERAERFLHSKDSENERKESGKW